MPFDKPYPNRKDHRKPHRKSSQRVCRGCRPGGNCGWCQNNRLHANRKREAAVGDRMEA